MEYKMHTAGGTPRLIIHGGAGNINPDTMTRERYANYHEALLHIVGTSAKNDGEDIAKSVAGIQDEYIHDNRSCSWETITLV